MRSIRSITCFSCDGL